MTAEGRFASKEENAKFALQYILLLFSLNSGGVLFAEV
jgi:hypothetical protein